MKGQTQVLHTSTLQMVNFEVKGISWLIVVIQKKKKLEILHLYVILRLLNGNGDVFAKNRYKNLGL